MVTPAELTALAQSGWPVMVKTSYDLCWLDCDQNGWLKTSEDGTQCICLCPVHALVLESGSFKGDYNGALLPSGSMANDWPWRPVSRTGVPTEAMDMREELGKT